jgi:hypothetical protein
MSIGFQYIAGSGSRKYGRSLVSGLNFAFGVGPCFTAMVDPVAFRHGNFAVSHD